MFCSDYSLLKTQFHNLKVPLYTQFKEVKKNDGLVNTIWGGTFPGKLVNLQAFSVAGHIWAHIKSVRSDSGTSSALSHWYKSSQLLWHFAWVNQVAGLSGIVLCQQQSWASWDPHSPIAFSSRLGLSHLQNRINSNLVWSAYQILTD